MKLHLLIAAALLSGACNTDPDEDGVVNKEEKELGTDPKLADSDGDGDADGVEINLGLDPLDPESHTYTGKWPMLPPAEKDAIETGRAGDRAEVGKRFKRFRFKDQHGEEVDLYDFAHQGKPIVIDISAQWCPPCNEMARWLEEPGDQPFGIQSPDGGVNELTPAVRKAVKDGSMYWITIMGQGDNGPANLRVVREWHREYPTEQVPVLADTYEDAVDFALGGGWPTLIWVDQDMIVQALDDYAPITEFAESR